MPVARPAQQNMLIISRITKRTRKRSQVSLNGNKTRFFMKCFISIYHESDLTVQAGLIMGTLCDQVNRGMSPN